MKGWVGLVGWPVADGLPTLVVTHQLQVERRTGKVRQSETDVLPLCYATNMKYDVCLLQGCRSNWVECWRRSRVFAVEEFVKTVCWEHSQAENRHHSFHGESVIQLLVSRCKPVVLVYFCSAILGLAQSAMSYKAMISNKCFDLQYNTIQNL